MGRRQRRRKDRRQEFTSARGWQTTHSLITGATLSAGAVLGLSPAIAAGATFQVDNNGDDAGDTACTATLNDCSLRGAITDANANGNPTQIDYITFASSLSGQTITLNGTELPPISEPLYIDGPGANQLTISGNNTSRIFEIDMSGPTNLPVGIYRLTLTGGHVSGNGGAIYDGDGVLKVNESVLTGNYASQGGGAIFENGADAAQGANNVIYADTITGNAAGDQGGGIYGAFSIGTLASSTVTGNQIADPSTTGHDGAGVYSYSYGYIVDSTIAGNGPADRGGGVAAPYGMEIYSSIVANNTASDFPDIGAGVPLVVGFSLIENGSPIATEEGPNLIGQDPQLGPLQNNGGLTPTMRPAPTSPVVDQGHSRFGRDQRLGDRRVDNPNVANAAGGDAADMGALELSLAEGPQAAGGAQAPPPPPLFNLKKAIKRCKKKFEKGAKRKRCIKKAKRKAAGA